MIGVCYRWTMLGAVIWVLLMGAGQHPPHDKLLRGVDGTLVDFAPSAGGGGWLVTEITHEATTSQALWRFSVDGGAQRLADPPQEMAGQRMRLLAAASGRALWVTGRSCSSPVLAWQEGRGWLSVVGSGGEPECPRYMVPLDGNRAVVIDGENSSCDRWRIAIVDTERVLDERRVAIEGHSFSLVRKAPAGVSLMTERWWIELDGASWRGHPFAGDTWAAPPDDGIEWSRPVAKPTEILGPAGNGTYWTKEAGGLAVRSPEQPARVAINQALLDTLPRGHYYDTTGRLTYVAFPSDPSAAIELWRFDEDGRTEHLVAPVPTWWAPRYTPYHRSPSDFGEPLDDLRSAGDDLWLKVAANKTLDDERLPYNSSALLRWRASEWTVFAGVTDRKGPTEMLIPRVDRTILKWLQNEYILVALFSIFNLIAGWGVVRLSRRAGSLPASTPTRVGMSLLGIAVGAAFGWGEILLMTLFAGLAGFYVGLVTLVPSAAAIGGVVGYRFILARRSAAVPPNT